MTGEGGLNFLMIGKCACCNFSETQEIFLSHPPSKNDFKKAREKLLARHSLTGCRASMIGIGLTRFFFDKFNVIVKFQYPLTYYLYGE
jgi:hypothetical protein